MTYDFSGKNAVVTGASRGIGAAIARTLAEDGARVALVARDTEALEALAKELPNDPVVLHADLSSSDGWKPLAEAIVEQLGPVDILVNNAGVNVHEPAGEVSEEGLDSTLSVNVRNLILLTNALSESLKSRKGNVVNISSVSASTGSIGQIAYSASKGAVNSMTRNLSIDIGRYGVRVNAVAPGVIDDGMWTTAFESGAVDREKTMERISRVIPLEGRWGKAQNIADAVAFLASDKADYITGQVLRVDGGILA
ncbi:SDR family NAD(P)-dependent oxidoreductase [Henriciella aquimarina]|uniref:SDR family NAD(P)-dependent oxidoreductase n=1 Tax=Henriciella aquimarina TaxID=545261 RepID=UPI000A03F56A|nr:SDR family NAD(P)-dependent oxidoreductase [Henriciella aquimarina]